MNYDNRENNAFSSKTMNCSNGRVNILGPNVDARFQMTDKIPVNHTTSFRDALTGNWNTSALSDAFFSSENVSILQNGIKRGVYDKSHGKFVIDKQDADQLGIIMRSIFLQHSANMPTNLTEQITSLNRLVLDYCIHQVYGETQGYLKYRQDASTMYTPMNRPIKVDYDDKTLQLKPWF
jgi:hypothetical protein